jgi:purine-nucleoside phosphorylase
MELLAMTVSAKVAEAVAYVRSRSPLAPQVAIVLGSGLGAFTKTIERAVRVAYGTIPNCPATSVPGHVGELVIGVAAGRPVAVFSGRFHLYEGFSAEDVAFPIRLAAGLGARTLIATNAAGAVNVAYRPGDLLLITDHLNLTGANPLTGPLDPGLGERFVDMVDAYDPDLLALAEEAARKTGITVRRGVYIGLAGPSYETPAEIKMARTLGADAVGMSTVLEVIAARQQGMRVLGVSCLTNMAAGVAKKGLDHAAVLQASATASAAVGDLLAAVIQRVGGRA